MEMLQGESNLHLHTESVTDPASYPGVASKYCVCTLPFACCLSGMIMIPRMPLVYLRQWQLCVCTENHSTAYCDKNE